MGLARKIDVILATELSRWGRSTVDLLHSLRDHEGRGGSPVAMHGPTFDLATAQGRLLATLLSGLAEFERGLIRERVKSGPAAAKARGKKPGRRPGHRPYLDHPAPRVPAMAAEGRSYRRIARSLGLSKNTVGATVKRYGNNC